VPVLTSVSAGLPAGPDAFHSLGRRSPSPTRRRAVYWCC